MELYVTRHGETEYNWQQRYTGNTDVPLNHTGKEQAEVLADILATIKFDIIVSSPLVRAIETAETLDCQQLFGQKR